MVLSGKFGNSTWQYLALSVIILTVYLLSSANECSSIDFCTAIIFSVVLFFSVILVYIRIGIDGAKVSEFLFKKPTLITFIWLPIGIVGIFAVSVIASNLGEQLIGIFLAGIVIAITLFKTNFLPIPILVHGAYNAIVINIQSSSPGSLLSTAPFAVPEIGLSFPDVSKLGSESLFQFLLVAGAEEFLRVLATIFVVVAISGGTFDNKSRVKIAIGLAIATGIWAIYHTIVV